LGLCAQVCLHNRWLAQAGAEVCERDVKALENWLLELRGYAEPMLLLAGDSRIPHQPVMLVDRGAHWTSCGEARRRRSWPGRRYRRR
jgi:hypothetical protein